MVFNWFKKKDKQPKTPLNDTQIESEEMQEETVVYESPNESEAATEATDDKEPRAEDEPLQTSETEAEAQAHESASDPLETEPQTANDGIEPGGFFSRLKKGLTKTRTLLTTDIEDIFKGKQGVDDDMLEELEELLITSDMGVSTTMDLMAKIEKKASKISGAKELQQTIKEEIIALFDQLPPSLNENSSKPHVVMVIGVNGVGKTTTIGKLAAKSVNSGQKVLIAAADTFRAAAIEQLTIWAERSNADIVKHKANADPAAVAFDSMEAALARGIDTVFVDTAGRLHTKVNLMEELKKIHRTIAKKIPGAPHEILLVLDATTGQNALSQAKLFNEAMGITGLALTKLDGTAKGGIVVSICTTLNLPLKYIGVGESIEDLQDFDPHQFVEALL